MSICEFTTKPTETGTRRRCTRHVMGSMPMTAGDMRRGAPYYVRDGKRYTGSDIFCFSHQIHEKNWPDCRICGSEKVSPKSSGDTAGCGRACIEAEAYLPLDKRPEEPLPVSTEASTWATVARKRAPAPTTVTNTPAAVKVSPALREAEERARVAQAEVERLREEIEKEIRADTAKREAEEANRKWLQALATHGDAATIATIVTQFKL